MSIPIREGVTTSAPSIAVETSDSNIPRKPILVEGGDIPAVINPLSITENGTYTAPSGVDGYSPVTVNVATPAPALEEITITENGEYTPTSPNVGFSKATVNVPPSLPNEYLESEWDLLHCNSSVGFYNSVKNVYLTGGFRGFENGYLSENNDYVNLAYSNYGDVKRFVVEMGAFDRTQEPSQQYFGLFSLVSGEQTCVLYYDNNNDRWLISESPSDVYISGADLPKYALENATVEIVYGAKYIDGTLYRGKKLNNVISEDYSQYITMYIHAENNQEYIIDYNKDTTAHSMGEMFTARIGTTGSVWTGALFKNAKIYNVLDCYDKYYEEVQ